MLGYVLFFLYLIPEFKRWINCDVANVDGVDKRKKKQIAAISVFFWLQISFYFQWQGGLGFTPKKKIYVIWLVWDECMHSVG